MNFEKLDFIITVDRTLMTNHHGLIFIGFMTTSPAVFLPEKLWMWICAPKPKCDKFGRPLVAPYGLRKIESALINAGFKASIIDPDYLGKYIKKSRALLIGHHDFFAFCAPSNTWWAVLKKEPVNRKHFIQLMEREDIKYAKLKNGLKIIIGGPAAWQWLHVEDFWEKWYIDCVIDGEAEKVIIKIAEKIINNEPIPKYIFVSPQDVPNINEIPNITYPSTCGLIEIMRGCPRYCKFCSVCLRPLRYIPIEKIIKEVKVNVSYGIKHTCLHSEDVLLYGAYSVKPKPEPLIKLHEELSKYVKSIGWSHASLAAIVYAEKEYKLISKIMEIIKSKFEQDWLGFQTGIETGSPKLAKILMPAKAAPYPAEKWPDIVEEAFSIMIDHDMIPAATIILNLPEEDSNDVIKTIELLDRLKNYPSVIVPMYCVPMGVLKDYSQLLNFKIKPEHVEAMWKCLEHSLKWAPYLIHKYVVGKKNFALRFLIRLFVKFVEWKKKNLEVKIKEYLEKAREGYFEHKPVEEVLH